MSDQFYYVRVGDMRASATHGAMMGVSQLREFRKDKHEGQTVQGRVLSSWVVEDGPLEGSEVFDLELWAHDGVFASRLAFRALGDDVFV